MSKLFLIGFVFSLFAILILLLKIKIQEKKIERETKIKKEVLEKVSQEKKEKLDKINTGNNRVDFDSSIDILHNCSRRRK